MVGDVTLAAPEQFGHRWVVVADKGRSLFSTVATGSTIIRDPVPAHRAQAKYPGKNQKKIKNYY